MFAVPYACAEFHDAHGNVLYRITADQLRITTEMPESIRQDPLFALMIKDESLRAPDSKLELKILENDPDAKIEKDEKSAKSEKPAKTAGAKSGTAKTDDAKAGKPVNNGSSGTAKAGKAEGSATEPAIPENQTAPGEAKTSAAAAGKQ